MRGLKFHPVTPSRWKDLEKLFGPRGAYGGCWCMWWRLRASVFAHQSGRENKRAMKRLVRTGEVPGILAYVGGEPMAWCSIAPREKYAGLERSRTLKRVDRQPVWSVVCFFVAAPYRNKGLMVPLMRAAIAYAKKCGAKIVEGYPIEAGDKKLTGYDGFTGIVSAFRRLGFKRVALPSSKRPIMRYFVKAR